MKDSYKRRWIKALKSGQYICHNSDSFFRVDDTYNIMAVLYDINLHEINLTWVPHFTINGASHYYLGRKAKDFISISAAFCKKIELDTDDSILIYDAGVLKMDFDTASDWINNNL
jgi:hypothetical protein